MLLTARPAPGLWLAGSRDGSTLHPLAAAFSDLPGASAQQLALGLRGLRPGWHRVVRTRIDPTHDGSRAERASRVLAARDGTATLAVPIGPQAVVALDITLA